MNFIFKISVIIIQQGKKALNHKKKTSQNKTKIYVLAFKTMAIMINCYLFIYINVNDFKSLIYLINF